MTHEVLFQPLPSYPHCPDGISADGLARLCRSARAGTRPPPLACRAVRRTGGDARVWIIALSGAAWASIPASSRLRPGWCATLLLAALGIALRISVNQQIAAGASESRQQRLLLWLIAALLPLLIMPATLRYGLGDFVNSTYPDPWSYVMVADYLSVVARGAEGGLSALHQYAAHLMNARNASSAILAHLAIGLRRRQGRSGDDAILPAGAVRQR